VIAFHNWTVKGTIRQGIAQIRTTFIACFVTTGWYYIRNWVILGSPFVGGWDPSRGIQWWQDPSYRTWTQLISFGAALRQPIYAGVVSFWDAIYSTMWADGFLGGTMLTVDKIPWNIEWMEMGTWLSLLPTACILFGAFRLWSQDLRGARHNLLFAVAAIGIYFAAIIDLYVHVPIFSSAKASYALGLLPCFGVLAAAGSRPFLRIGILRSLFWASLTCWVTATYLAYFCVR
jgi:hypothetical protein